MDATMDAARAMDVLEMLRKEEETTYRLNLNNARTPEHWEAARERAANTIGAIDFALDVLMDVVRGTK